MAGKMSEQAGCIQQPTTSSWRQVSSSSACKSFLSDASLCFLASYSWHGSRRLSVCEPHLPESTSTRNSPAYDGECSFSRHVMTRCMEKSVRTTRHSHLFRGRVS